MNKLSAFIMTACVICTGFSVQAQTNDLNQPLPIESGPFKPDWESLKQYQVPEWFQNAKFGIWAHWGPQCQPEGGDWYARDMYYNGSGKYNFHLKKYGDPAQFGFKDVINAWKADNWNPDALVKLYKEAGARYFMVMGNHHDNLDMWDNPYQEWNTTKVGPKKDILAGWAKAAKKYKLPLGISIHASHAWTWYEGAQDYDGKLTKADGKGKWWEGLDPQELYAQDHPRSDGSNNVGQIHSQWSWGNGASQPSKAYITKFFNRTLDAVHRFNPDLLYFDDTVLPFFPIDEEVGLNIAADFYNHNYNHNHKKEKGVIMGKILDDEQKKALLWDVERGAPDKPQLQYWQTCTCIGSWHYNRHIYDTDRYKSAAMVIRMLVDIVSKNGNLLLNIPIRGDGSIDEKEIEIVKNIGAWMKINGESIYDTRVWKIYGEGPSTEVNNPMKAQGFNEGKTKYTAQDFRYVIKKNTLYATCMAEPKEPKALLKSVTQDNAGKVKNVCLLGYGAVPFQQTPQGLSIDWPEHLPNNIAEVLKITLDK